MMNLPPSNPNPWDSLWDALLEMPSFRAALEDPENRRRISEAYARPIIDPPFGPYDPRLFPIGDEQ
jgi:hypothetical protein